MLLLCSDGLTSDAILVALRSYTDKLQTAAIVVTADPEYKEKNYHVPRCTAELTRLGLAVDLLDIDTVPCEVLNEYDVVEFIGGNPFYLLSSIQKHQAESTLLHLASTKVLIGWSASAFVFGPTLALVNEYSPELNTVELKDCAKSN